MTITSKLKKIFGMATKEMGHPFYESPQTYEVSFSAEIYNKSNEALSLAMVLPIPFSDAYQIRKNDIIFSPEGHYQGTDSLYNNAYAWWWIKVLPQKSQFVRENFTMEIRPRSVDLGLSFATLSDYTKLDQRLYQRFTNLNRFLNAGDPRVQDIIKKIVGNEKKIKTILLLLNEYVISRLTYGKPIPGLYTASDALEKDRVDCGGFDSLLGSLLMGAGIPVRIVSGFFAGYPENSMHAWLEVLLPDGSWVSLDPSIEKLTSEGKTQKSGKLGFVGSDRIALSSGCDLSITVDGKELEIDILQNPIIVSNEGREGDISLKTVFATSRV